jgi:hypothetical protein
MILDTRRVGQALYIEWAESLKKHYDRWFDDLDKWYPINLTLPACRRRCDKAFEAYSASIGCISLGFERHCRLEVSQRAAHRLQAIIRDVCTYVLDADHSGTSYQDWRTQMYAMPLRQFAEIDELVDRRIATLKEAQATMNCDWLLPVYIDKAAP